MLSLPAHVHMQLFSHTSTFYMYVYSLLTSQQPHPLQWQSSTIQRIDTRTSFLVSGFGCLGMRNDIRMYGRNSMVSSLTYISLFTIC